LDSLPPWRVLQSHHLHSDRWIRIRVDRCETAEGVEVSPYYVLEYPDWTHIVAIGSDRQVLLVEQYRHGAGVVTLEIPAGRVDPADGSPEVTARRELLEETGCTAASFVRLNGSSPNPASHANQVHTVLAREVSLFQTPADDPRERLRNRWVTPREAYDMAIRGVIPALQAASLLSAFDALGWLSFGPGEV
jgi:8-oxo-dGTP pyrophosphatase MutT (NUDIX family)